MYRYRTIYTVLTVSVCLYDKTSNSTLNLPIYYHVFLYRFIFPESRRTSSYVRFVEFGFSSCFGLGLIISDVSLGGGGAAIHSLALPVVYKHLHKFTVNFPKMKRYCTFVISKFSSFKVLIFLLIYDCRHPMSEIWSSTTPYFTFVLKQLTLILKLSATQDRKA